MNLTCIITLGVLIFFFSLNAASLFGEHRKLEPLPPDRKQRWRREVDWLLAVTDYIVELVPSQQVSNGKSMEVKLPLFFPG